MLSTSGRFSDLHFKDTRMELILWRHAEAEDGDDTILDHERRLTARGNKQAKQVARWLHKHLPQKPRILVTQQTANALELAYEIEPGLGIGASASEVLTAAGWPDHRGAVLIVGHQPTLGRVAAKLLAGEEADWSIRKGAIWWFSSRERDGERQTLLRAVLTADIC
jgi:phosphohistidine phosphatase